MLAVGGSKEDVRRLGFDVHKVKRSGNDPVPTILRYLRKHEPDLIVLATAGRNGFLDALSGSPTEQVLREAKRPVLAIPASD